MNKLVKWNFEKPKHKLNKMRHLKEFSSHSTVHGIGYVFDKELGMFDRSLWLGIVTVCVCVAVGMISSSYTTWQENMVITTLKTTTKPVTELFFPSVTICADGRHMDLVEKALYYDFTVWRNQTNHLNSLEEDIAMFLKIKFQLTDNQTSIMEILNTMINPKSSENNDVREMMTACAKVSRTKRDIAEQTKSKYLQKKK